DCLIQVECQELQGKHEFDRFAVAREAARRAQKVWRRARTREIAGFRNTSRTSRENSDETRYRDTFSSRILRGSSFMTSNRRSSEDCHYSRTGDLNCITFPRHIRAFAFMLGQTRVCCSGFAAHEELKRPRRLDFSGGVCDARAPRVS